MKVCFAIRQDYMENMAGDSVQFLKTKEFLQKQGVQVEVVVGNLSDIKKYDIVHLFNTIRIKETYENCIRALEKNKKIVLSPIYWNPSKYYNGEQNYEKKIKWNRLNPLREFVFKHVDMILPSSKTEMDAISKDFNIRSGFSIIPNGVDPYILKSSPQKFIKEIGQREFVLSVGRICEHKNQLGLITALSGTNIPIVLAGPINDTSYFNKCMEVPGRVYYIGEVEHSELGGLYKAARVHALPSKYEIPGLSSLEAGLCGCNIVTTREGSTVDYFKDMAIYCDSLSLASIRNGVIKAYTTPKNHILKNYIKYNFTWGRISQKIKTVYEKTLLK